MSDSELLEQIRNLLPDNYSHSKDWKQGDVIERIEWLKARLESKTREADLWIDQINQTLNG